MCLYFFFVDLEETNNEFYFVLLTSMVAEIFYSNYSLGQV
jgi:hypothetical protein